MSIDPVGSEAGDGTPSRRNVLLRRSLTAVSVVFLAFLLYRAVRDGDGVPRPSTIQLVLGLLAAIGGHFAAGLSWASLTETRPDRNEMMSSFLLSAPARYLPGGFVAQAFGQVGLAEVSLRKRTVAGLYVVYIGIVVLAAVFVAGFGAFVTTELGGLGRLLIVGLLAPAALHRPTLARVVAVVGKVTRRQNLAGSLPPQRNLVESFGWSVATMLAIGFTIGVLLDDGPSLATTVPSVVLAWLVGFLVVPVPSGIGVREAVLVVVLGDAAEAVVVIAVLQRLMEVIATFVGVIAAWWVRR